MIVGSPSAATRRLTTNARARHGAMAASSPTSIAFKGFIPEPGQPSDEGVVDAAGPILGLQVCKHRGNLAPLPHLRPTSPEGC